jgi:hypothetical protein
MLVTRLRNLQGKLAGLFKSGFNENGKEYVSCFHRLKYLFVDERIILINVLNDGKNL